MTLKWAAPTGHRPITIKLIRNHPNKEERAQGAALKIKQNSLSVKRTSMTFSESNPSLEHHKRAKASESYSDEPMPTDSEQGPANVT